MNISRSIILIFSFLIILLWSSLTNEGLFALSEQTAPDNGINHALIIGIGDYDQFSKLESPQKDANEISRILTEKYNFNKENVILLTDTSTEKPTLINIITYLDKYVNELTEDDNLLIFYSGHSEEDDEGETYWIPKDANEKLKMTWINHSDICNEYLASEELKAKSVIIITDSPFSKALLKPTQISLSPYDLRYTEKIREKALKKSREVLSFGDKHWEAGKSYEGYGLFTYYFRKALMDNWLRVIDIENLLFDEDIVFEIRKIAGTRLLRGRLKQTTMDEDGQTIISRVVSPPPINVTDAYVTPKKGYAGDQFIIEALTNRPAFEVYVELDGRMYLMEGEGTNWKRPIKVTNIGTSTFSTYAINEDDVEGTPKSGQINTIRPETGMINVATASVSPNRGVGGDEFTFSAKTDAAASRVALVIADKRYQMTGSGTDWSLMHRVEETGSVAYSIVAMNEDGVEGRLQSGVLSIQAPDVNIVTVEAQPAKGYAGDDFLITASTDHPARSVTLQLDDMTYEMEGSGNEWQLKRKISDIGTKQFTVIARNTEGRTGRSKIGEILTTEKPPGIPDVTSVAWLPEKVRAGENFVINVKTAEDAQDVFIELAGKQIRMQGSGTQWRYSTQIASVGSTNYKVIARNRNGQEGQSKEGEIITTEKVGIDVIQVAVSPEQGNVGETFTFNATTETPAKSVAAVIAGKRYAMSGSGTSWSLTRNIEDLGAIDYYVIATDDKDEEGGSRGGSFVTKALLANVVKASVTSDKGYAGEEFTVTVSTDNPADAVSLDIDGVIYEMEGSGRDWNFKKTIHDVGTKPFIITAKNIEGVSGRSRSGEIVALLAVPDVMPVSFSTDQIFAGDNFIIKAQTTAAAEEVFIEIDGKRQPMEGAGTEWSLQTNITNIGTSKYIVIAKNSKGLEGQPGQGSIIVEKKPGALVNVATADVQPAKGYSGGTFTFTASTEIPAQSVMLTIGGVDYEMTGSGTNWTLAQKIQRTGELAYSITAINEDNVEGIPKTATFAVAELTERYTYNEDGTVTDKVTGEVRPRFVDNGDGTVTDISTNLMWLQSPKRVAVNFDEAEKYCRELVYNDYSGWRLPTVQEWQGMIDKSQEAPALPLGHPFKNVVTSTLFWSKTKHTSLAQRVYVTELFYGRITNDSKTKDFIVWPVRYTETAD